MKLAGACFIYMDIQLYTLEPASDKVNGGTYLVDFKCAGYEPLLERILPAKEGAGEGERISEGCGYRLGDKDVTSPQPFLDMVNRLVIYLAKGGG